MRQAVSIRVGRTVRLHHATVLLFLCVLAASESRAFAQVLYGTLTGVVADSTGAAIPNTSVVLTNPGTAEIRTVVTNSQGEYAARNLPPGTYNPSVQQSDTFAGFTQKT